ncbi:PAS domain-containing sensor histidine kinase [Pedobacter rhodius]|uniref:histidine kinase n=1 Tax=Pedobacter rhodius TaxID=3004098 RepID=A0ABT4KVW5_9SPHI|nr:PAS domain-containing sensor histidine kinase [Pedobacter sp. SJ11]MCZ4223073.1 PAS domain-containing sensor histidine kinase [Pedobacter sp. SJ11]
MPELNPELFCRIGDSSRDIFLIFDVKENYFSYLSPAFEPIFEIPIDHVKTNPSLLLTFVHDEDKAHVLDCFNECTHEDASHKYEFRIVCKEGQTKYIRVSVYPIIIDGNLTQLSGIVEDVSISKHNNFHIEKINARKNTALEIVSHDLKEPLAMISMAVSDLLSNKLFNGQERILKSLTFIKDMCERNILLIRNLINHEFLRSSEVEIRKERTDLVKEIKDVIGFYQHAELNLFRNFEFVSSEQKLYAKIDSMKFMQVINNLISNSIKFTHTNGNIKVVVKDKVETVLIMVSDNGIGIPKHLQPFLFERFSIAMREGLHGEDSWGLGMAIIKSIVNLHDGTIWFESMEHAGSTFYIEIPK